MIEAYGHVDGCIEHLQQSHEFECRLCEDVEASELFQRFLHNYDTHGMIPQDIPDIIDHAPETEDWVPRGTYGLNPTDDPVLGAAQRSATGLLFAHPERRHPICQLVHELTPTQLQMLDPILEQIRTFVPEMRGRPILMRCYQRIALH